MRRMIVLSLLAGATALAGCASNPGVTPYWDVDFAQVAKVENSARQNGRQVYWHQYPKLYPTAPQSN